MPFVPDTAPTDAPPRRGGFVPDAPPPAAPEPLPARVPGTSIGLGIPGVDPEWAAGRAPEQVASRQRRDAAERNPIRDGVVGLVEGALDIVAKVVGGGIGGIGGMWYGVATGQKPDEMMAEGAQRGVGVVRDIYRQTRLTSGGEPETEFGRTLTEGADRVLQALPAVGTGPRGTLVSPMPEGAVSTAVRAVRDVGRAAGDAALEAATPRMNAQKQALAAKAVAADIPINLHQLTDNPAVRLAGELAETIPGSGSKRQQRREAFTGGLVRAIDPESKETALTPDVFAQLQDKAGEAIGGIMDRYEVPRETFGDLGNLTNKQTPDIAKVVTDYIGDLDKIAAENNGVVPGTTLRKLRTQAQQQIRNTPNGDLRTALNNFVNRLDKALGEVASEGDLPALADARRRYAISVTLEPLVAKSSDGIINPQSLMAAVTGTKAGKRRMARGNAGELGEYARIGQEFLKDVKSSGTAERGLVWSALTDVGELAKIGVTYPLALAYNLLGPKAAKKLIEAQKRRREPGAEPPPPEPTLGRGFEDVPQRPEPGGEAPLGDLTPEWGTTPGAAPAREGGIEPAGLVRAVDETEPLPQGIPQRPGAQIPLAEEKPLGDLTPDWTTEPGAGGAGARAAEPGLVPALGEEAPSTGTRVDMRSRGGLEIPAVPGRPDLPDTLTVGGPAESAATAADNAAMMTPGAIEARRQQGMAAVERAAAAERAEPVPVGEATEITPESVKPAPGMPDEPIPVGEATEITPENVKPAPEVKEHPEVAKIRQDIAKKREAEAKKQAAADELRAAAAAETDPEVKAALIKRADAIAPAKKQEKTDGTPSEPVGTGGVRKEASQEGVQEGGDAGAQVAKGGEEALDLGLPKIDEGLLDLQQRAAERASPPPAPSPRGRRQVRRALERGIAEGTLDKDGASLALWALDRNENLARGLRVEVLQPEPGAGGKGSYNSATRIAKLFQGEDNPQTAMHEILHHAERMMPDAVQQGIYRDWQRALKAAMKDATPERTKAMEALNRASSGDKAALTEAKRAYDSGVLSEDDYQYVNPTEYWAVNGARIMHERFTGRGSWRAQARQWMREMIEHVKETVGVRSDSPLLKTLNELLDPAKTTGAQKSPTMIKNRPEGGGSLTSEKTAK